MFNIRNLGKALVGIIIIGVLSINNSFAFNVTGASKATATLSAACQINARDVVFGVIDPRTSTTGVTATSSMDLFCSKGASYTISLGGTNANYTVDGNYFGNSYACPNSCAGIPTNYHYYYVYSGTTDYNQTPASYSSRVLYYNGTFIQNYSTLKGMVSGDTISYKITVPGNDAQIWTRGNYNYTTTGTGAIQSIPVKATLTTSAYPTPDNYSDTVIATVSF